MYVLLYIAIASGVYVGTFKNEFDEADMGKALAFIVIVSAIFLVVNILGSI